MNLELNAKETALVLIDLQHGIVGRQLAPYSGTDVVAKAAKLAEATRAADSAVVYVHVLLDEVVPLLTERSTPRPAGGFPKDSSELVPEAGYKEGTDVLVAKRQWDAFYGTALDQHLRRRGVKTIVIGGIATNMGVESTARSAQARGYNVVFVEDAMSTMSEEMQTFAVKTMFPAIGRVRTSEDVMAALEKAAG